MNANAPRRRGLTLVELLAALSLLSLVVGATSAWTVGVVRTERAIVREAALEPPLDRTLRRLARDIDEALVDMSSGRLREPPVRFDAERDEIVVLRPGDGALDEPGWRRVVWRLDSNGDLLRESGAAQPDAASAGVLRRVALRAVEQFDVAPIAAPDAARSSGRALRITPPRATTTTRVVAYDVLLALRPTNLQSRPFGPAESAPRASRRFRWEASR